jgi:hypothetical protein
MKQPHPLPRRNWLGAGLSLLIMIAAALGIAWHVNQLVIAVNADPPAASVPGAATSDEETDRADWQR